MSATEAPFVCLLSNVATHIVANVCVSHVGLSLTKTDAFVGSF